jgi:hypothetical protein
MRNIFETISRENFRSSGYFSHPSSERRTEWQFTSPPRSPFNSADTVRSALLRRESAERRKQTKQTLLQNCLNVLFSR